MPVSSPSCATVTRAIDILAAAGLKVVPLPIHSRDGPDEVQDVVETDGVDARQDGPTASAQPVLEWKVAL